MNEIRIYADVDAVAINDEHRACFASADDCQRHAIRCGQLLAVKKASLKHGEWIPWIETNCEFDVRQAQKYLKIADNYQLNNGCTSQMRIDNSHLESAPNGEGLGMIDRIIGAIAKVEQEKKGKDGLTPKQRECCDWIQAHPGCGINEIIAAGFSRGTGDKCRDILGLKRNNRTSGPKKFRSRAPSGRGGEQSAAPSMRGTSSFVERLPTRPDRDEESLRYLDTLALSRVLESTRFDDDASLYHAIEPLMKQIREMIGRMVRQRTTESMGPFYRLVHELLAARAPQYWEACESCRGRNHKDGTCRKCKGCGYRM